MIIALSGRMHSGKSELASICEANGFEILKFADSLKDLICSLIGIDRYFLENNKETIYSYTLPYKMLANALDIPETNIIDIREDNTFCSIRDIMQFIGTDLIRKLKPSWHIDQLKRKIKKGRDYCIDDLRFKNEKEFIDSIFGECWYIIRPGNFNISNHVSEVALNWCDFGNKVVVNDIKLNTLINKWEKYLHTKEKFNYNVLGYNNKFALRDYLYDCVTKHNLTTKDIATIHKCSRDKIVWWCNRLLVPIKRTKYHTNNNSFLHPTKEASYYAGLLAAGGCIKKSGSSMLRYVVEFGSVDSSLVKGFKRYLGSNKPIYTKSSSGYSSKCTFSYFSCENPYILHNLKYWDLRPTKSTKEEIPTIICDNVECLKQWIVGLIDGDGSIFISNKTLGITILSSEKVIDFIYNLLPIKGKKSKHKDTELYELKWYNFKAVDVFKWLAPELCLTRKWRHIDTFLSFGTVKRS